MSRSRIELHIERLVLEGVDPRDRRSIGAALQEQLQQQLATGPTPALFRESAARDTVDCGSIEIGRAAPPRTVGSSVAGAIRRGLSA